MTKKHFIWFVQFAVDHKLSKRAIDELVFFFHQNSKRFNEKTFRAAIELEKNHRKELTNV